MINNLFGKTTTEHVVSIEFLRCANEAELYYIKQVYPYGFDSMHAHNNWWVPDFYKFNGEDTRSTMEHISLFLT